VRFPSLLFAGTLSVGELGKLTGVDMPLLMRANGTVGFDGNGLETEEPLVLNLPRLETSAGLSVTGNDGLLNLDGFASLRVAQGWVTVTGNNALIPADGLGNLENVGVQVEFSNNPLLQRVDLGQLRWLGTVSEGNLLLSNLPVLSELDVRTIPRIQGKMEFTDLGSEASAPLALDFRSLDRVGNGMRLWYVANLEDLSGFAALQTIVGGLSLSFNASLTDLRGLGALTTFDGILSVTYNISLPTCEAWWLRDHLRMMPNTVNINDNLADACE